MTRNTLVALVAAGFALAAAGCNPFLTGEGLTDDPNNPTTATREALFMGVQANTFGQQESGIALTTCMWMQQCTGGGGRFVEQFGKYVIDETSHSGDFNSVYTGGGLIDIRKIEASAGAAGDAVFLGIAQIYEALVVGSAADYWGDLPYTQALTAAAPTLDNQFAVYDSVQALLSRAIVNLGGAGPGPGARDLVFGGAPAAWIEVAHTMKARYYLHTVEAAGAGLITGRTAAQVYADAVAQATLGISAPANDFAAFHGASTSERNVWFQFSQTTFGTDLVAGKRLVDIMNARTDPRRPQYFGKNALGAYGGDDVNAPQPANTVSAVDGTRNSPTFRQPFVTYAENELILAEAYNRGTPAVDAQALIHLNNERTTVPLAALVGVTGAALFDSIMVEKYVALFQNPEVWSDYRRTCRPILTPFAGASPVFGGKIPGRLYYGSNERNTNPINIPAPSTQLATNGFRNRNDPNPCP
ncbi:MAG TPA: SusD/RagB family nutrient-binding outer membrane lipoprotein [Gemmatimonadales bacterium]|nr:SusD/RagB family nutrient-binding outer membrane lipoprotein [Gemmatimonadales bacterium]